ncbi:glycerophosphodiester phosphodiesterase family protein [Ilumatobacter coccineus]|nr:glycerophosphodiester phosphodiesterase family protein [Ilumatobacter coccineus]
MNRTPHRLRRVAAGGLAALAAASTIVVASSPTTAAPGDVILTEDFSGDALPAGWLADGDADWTVRDGRLYGHTDNAYTPSILTFGEHRDNVRIEATMRFEDVVNASRWAGIVTDVAPTGGAPWAHAVMRSESTASNGIEFAIRNADESWNVTDAGSAPVDAGVGNDVDVRIDIQGERGAWYFDDELVLSTTSVERTDAGVLGFVIAGATVSFDDLVVTELEPLADPEPEPEPEPELVRFEETFDGDSLPEGWTPLAGAWSVADGRLRLDEPSTQARITFGPHLDNYQAEFTLRFESVNNASRWAGLMTDVAADGSIPWAQAVMRSQSTAGNGIEFALRSTGGWNVTDKSGAPADAATGRDVQVRIVAQGSTGEWWFDGQLVLTTTRIERSDDGILGFIADGARVSIDDVVVTELPPRSLVRDPALGPITIAHRGYSSLAPENTLAAVEAALRSGAEMIEIDTYTSADDATIVIHDSTVDRTTDGTGAVDALSSAQLAELDAGSWFSSAYVDEPLPHLEQVLDLIKGRGPTLLLEIKPGASYDETEMQLQAVLDRDMVDQVVVQSFDAQVIRDAKTIAPEIPRGFLTGSVSGDLVAVANELGLSAYNPSVGAVLGRPEAVAELNAAGIAVMPWTVDDAGTWARLAEIGVDGIITNRPGEHIGFRQGSPIDVTVVVTEPGPDPVAPAVRVEQASTQADPATEQPVLFDVVFAEPVVGFGTDDVIVGGSAGATSVSLVELTPGVRYRVAVEGATADGTVTVSVHADAATTATGVGTAASTSTDNDVTVTLPEPLAECAVEYVFANTWHNGFIASVELSNTADEPIVGWELGWNFTAGERLRAGWLGDFSQDGTAVTVVNPAWDRVVDPGETVIAQFIGKSIDPPVAPTTFTLDGVTCGG